jgi:hypothetical protein
MFVFPLKLKWVIRLSLYNSVQVPSILEKYRLPWEPGRWEATARFLPPPHPLISLLTPYPSYPPIFPPLWRSKAC